MAAALSLVQDSTDDVVRAIRSACWAARDLRLLEPAELERILGRTVERMTGEDLSSLSAAARRLSELLGRESGRRP